MPGRLLILGAGGHGRAVAELARACGWTVAGFTDLAGARGRPEVVGIDAEVPGLLGTHAIDGVVVGVGSAALPRRAALFQVLVDTGVVVPALVHPRAVLASSCEVRSGTVIFPGTVLGHRVRIGLDAVLYSAVVVEHESVIGDHAYLSPGVILSGRVTVGAGAFLGAGAVVLPGLHIGAGAVVAAGGVVTTDVAAGATVMGVPARARRRGEIG